MKKMLSKAVLAAILVLSMFSQNVMAFELPDELKKFASDVASDITDAGEHAGDTITGAFDAAGKAASGAAEKAEEITSGAASQIGTIASETGKKLKTSEAAQQIEDFAAGFTSKAGNVASEWGHWAGETADGVKTSLSKAGVTVAATASEMREATNDKAAELTAAAGKQADEAISAVKGAGNMVIDQAGHVVNLASAGAGYASSAAGSALKILKEKGDVLMQIAQDAIGDIDLSDEQNWTTAKKEVERAIDEAYKTGVIDKKVDRETVQIVTNILFGTMMYTYQYSNGQISLGDYAKSMSEVIIREGLPTGIGFITDLLPTGPINGDISKEVTYYLISVAYGDDSGEVIEEDEEMLLEEISE